MKPIPTLYRPLKSVDLISKQPFQASVERSDTCAVPAAAVVGEAAVAIEIAKLFLEKFSGDFIEEITVHYQNYADHLRSF
jgi:chorismate synthase